MGCRNSSDKDGKLLFPDQQLIVRQTEADKNLETNESPKLNQEMRVAFYPDSKRFIEDEEYVSDYTDDAPPHLHLRDEVCALRSVNEIMIDYKEPVDLEKNLVHIGFVECKNAKNGDERVAGTWRWWSNEILDKKHFYVDGASLVTDDFNAAKKLRGLRAALERQIGAHKEVNLNFSQCYILSKGCFALSALLSAIKIPHMSLVTSLNLSKNPIGDEGLGALLGNMMKTLDFYGVLPLPRLNTLILSNCNLQECGFIMKHNLFDMPYLFPELTQLDLSNNKLSSESFHEIIKGIATKQGVGKTLANVSFANNHLSPVCMVYLKDALQLIKNNPKPLHVINVSGHCIEGAQDMEKEVSTYLKLVVGRAAKEPKN